MLSKEQIEMLSAHLDRSVVRTRQQAGRSLSFIEGWHAIAEANRIFGFEHWASETLDVRCVNERECSIGKSNPYQGWTVTYTAKVRVTVYAGERTIVREGIGAGHGIDRDLGQAHESAIKEAETDARKRALMTWGNPFGLALYDKEQRNVADTEPAARGQTQVVADVARGWVGTPEGEATEPQKPAARSAPKPVPVPANRRADAVSQIARDKLLEGLNAVYTLDSFAAWRKALKDNGDWSRMSAGDRDAVTRAARLKEAAVRPAGSAGRSRLQ